MLWPSPLYCFLVTLAFWVTERAKDFCAFFFAKTTPSVLQSSLGQTLRALLTAVYTFLPQKDLSGHPNAPFPLSGHSVHFLPSNTVLDKVAIV